MWGIVRRRLTKWVSVRRKPEGPGRFAPIPAGSGLPAPRVRPSPAPLILNQTGAAEWFHLAMKRSKGLLSNGNSSTNIAQ